MATIKSFTSLEQSKKLLELGLRPQTADMYWDYDENTQSLSEAMAIPIYEGSWELHHKNWSKDIPCWSVGALLELMPMVNGREPHLIWTKGTYTCFYYCGHKTTKETMIEAVYNMVIWLLENNYIKKGE